MAREEIPAYAKPRITAWWLAIIAGFTIPNYGLAAVTLGASLFLFWRSRVMERSAR